MAAPARSDRLRPLAMDQTTIHAAPTGNVGSAVSTMRPRTGPTSCRLNDARLGSLQRGESSGSARLCVSLRLLPSAHRPAAEAALHSIHSPLSACSPAACSALRTIVLEVSCRDLAPSLLSLQVDSALRPAAACAGVLRGGMQQQGEWWEEAASSARRPSRTATAKGPSERVASLERTSSLPVSLLHCCVHFQSLPLSARFTVDAACPTQCCGRMLSSSAADSPAAAAAVEPVAALDLADPVDEDESAAHHLLLSVATPEAAADSHTMQRMGGGPSGMRNYSPSPAHSNGGLLWTKSGALDRHKLGLVVLLALLGLWVIYDTCAHLHQESFAEAVQRAQDDMSREGAGGSAHAVGSVLRAPGSADGGKLPESLMFRNLDYRSTSFFNAAGVLANPIQPAHLVSKEVNGLHVATIVPGQTRGNHMHNKHSEVLVLVHGKFMLRVAMIGNDVSARRAPQMR